MGFQERGIPKPEKSDYPYTEEMVLGWSAEEDEKKQAGSALEKRWDKELGADQETGSLDVSPGGDASFHPARHVMRCRSRSPSPVVTQEQRGEWLAEAKEQRDWCIRQQMLSPEPKGKKR